MFSWTTEVKVGLFTIVTVVLLALSYLWTLDGVRGDESSYDISLRVPTAQGLWVGTPVKLAGVDVGAIKSIEVEGNQAKLVLTVRSAYELPTDSTAELKSSGLLGDYHIRVTLGREDATIPPGGRIEFGKAPGDLDVITKQVELISEDVKAITGALRELTDNRENSDHVESTLANVDALSYELRLLAENNRRDIDAIVDSVKRLTTTLEAFAIETSSDVDLEMDKLHDATDKLDAAMADIKSITGKIDAGEGTIGALVNDDETIDALNETIDNINSVVESFSGLRAKVYYTGRFYFGTQPADTETFFYGNPLAFAGSNTIGIDLYPQEDFWWIFQINDHPAGNITSEQRFYPEQGYFYTEWVRRINYRFTFQLSKRWYDFSFRIGVKESGGGVGVTWHTAKERVTVSADVFDFAFGSFPALEASGLPNLRVAARWEPVNHLYVEGGMEQVLLGARYNYVSPYIGGGFHFNDDDIKLLLTILPLGF